MSDFVAPKKNPFVVACAKAFLPVFLHVEKLEVIPSKNCLQALRQLHGKPTVIVMNHSDRYDPVAVFALSKPSHENFYYLAARELFDKKFSGWFMQNCGAYSVVRGSEDDEESKEKTISLMTQTDRKLIEFPEGDVTGRDDAIMPLKHDGMRNVLLAQQRLMQQGDTTLNVLPTAIFYQLQTDGVLALHNCLDQLEAKLGITRIRGAVGTRALSMLDTVLDRLHEKYELNRTPSPTVPDQLTTLARNIILKLARNFNVQIEGERPEAVMLYDLRGQLRERDDAKAAVPDLDRVQRLFITASTLDQPLTPEIEWRLVDRLEEEITGNFTVKGSRIAWIETAQPVEVRDVLRRHHGEISDAAIADLSSTVRGAMLSALTGIRSAHEHSVQIPA